MIRPCFKEANAVTLIIAALLLTAAPIAPAAEPKNSSKLPPPCCSQSAKTGATLAGAKQARPTAAHQFVAVNAPAAKAEGAAKNNAAAKAGGKWRSLFNGKDLTGWKIKIRGYKLGDNHNDTFRVENGLLKVAYDKYDEFAGKFGHIFYEKPFSNYRLRVEYRFVGEQSKGGPGWAFRNSGIMIHGQSPESMRVEQNFPVSIEVQLLGGGGQGDRPTANLCTPGTHVVLGGKLHKRHCTNSKSKTYHGDQWVTVELEVRGNKLVRHIIDGKTVLEYTQPQLDERDGDAKKLIEKQQGDKMLGGGSISLQAESHPVEFRKVEIMELEK